MNRIRREGNIIILRSGGPDEWAKSHAIRDAFIAQWEAEAAAKDGEVEVAPTDNAQEQATTVKVGGKDEHRIFDAVTAHYKALAEGATPETAPPLPEISGIEHRENDVVILRSGGPDEWAASNAIIAEARARWEAEAKNGEVEVASTGGAQAQTITVKVGGSDENRIFDAITAQDKSLV